MMAQAKESPRSPKVLVLPASIGLEGRTMGGGERYAAEYTRALAKITHAEQALFCHGPSIPPGDSPPTRLLTWTTADRPILPPLTRNTWDALSEYDVLHLMCFPNSVADGFLASGICRSQLVILTDIGGGGRCCSTYLSKVNPRCNPYRYAHGFAHLSEYAGSLIGACPRLYCMVGLGNFSPRALGGLTDTRYSWVDFCRTKECLNLSKQCLMDLNLEL